MLIIDIGNTNTKLLYCVDSKNYEVTTKSMLLHHNLNNFSTMETYSVILVSSVLNKKHTYEIITQVNRLNKKVYLLNSQKIFSLVFNQSIANKLKNIGTDRALKILYLISLPNTSSISIGCGTAFTMEVVKNQQFVDSYILPGFNTQQDSLLQTAEQINNVRLHDSNSEFYQTETSIYKGIIFSYISLIKYVSDIWQAEILVLSGGDAKLIDSHIRSFTNKVLLIEYHELKIMQHFSNQLINEKPIR